MIQVSVVVPAYNASETIRRCAESLLAQDWSGEYEVIVVDDGSSDQTGQIVADMAQASDREIRLIRQSNGGAGSARNRGVEEARAPLVAFCDADDVWKPDLLSCCVPPLERQDVQAVLGGYAIEGAKGAKMQVLSADVLAGVSEPLGDDRFLIEPGAAFGLRLDGKYIGCADTLVIRTDAYRDIGGFPEDCAVAEDVLTSLRIISRLRIVYVARPVAVYHQAMDTRSRKDMVITWENAVKMYERFAEEDQVPAGCARAFRKKLASTRMSLAISRWRQGLRWFRDAFRSCREFPSWRQLRTLVSLCLTRPAERDGH